MEEPESKNSSPKQEELKLSSLEDLKQYKKVKDDGQLIKLPDSQLVIKVSRPTITGMLKREVIPSGLIHAVLKLDENKKPEGEKELLEFQQVIDVIVMEAVTQPKIVEKDAKEGELNLEDLTERDRSAIYTYVQLGLEPFRILLKEAERFSAGLISSSLSGAETKPDDGNKESLDSLPVRPRNRNSSNKDGA